MKKLDVPSFLQEVDSPDCGPVYVQMVLEHFGMSRDLSILRDRVEYGPEGTSAYDNGMTLISEGLTVEAITAHPFLFPPDILSEIGTDEALIEHLEKRGEKLEKFKGGIGKLIRYLGKGGSLRIEIPSLAHIKEAIDSDAVVIALLYGKGMGSLEGGFHFVVVNGYDDDRVFITNPSPHSSKQAWVPADQFLYAVHTSTLVDIDNGTLLIISKGKPV